MKSDANLNKIYIFAFSCGYYTINRNKILKYEEIISSNYNGNNDGMQLR